MTVEELIEELKALPPTARVETHNGTPVGTDYALGIVWIELEGLGDDEQ